MNGGPHISGPCDRACARVWRHFKSHHILTRLTLCIMPKKWKRDLRRVQQTAHHDNVDARTKARKWHSLVVQVAGPGKQPPLERHESFVAKSIVSVAAGQKWEMPIVIETSDAEIRYAVKVEAYDVDVFAHVSDTPSSENARQGTTAHACVGESKITAGGHHNREGDSLGEQPKRSGQNVEQGSKPRGVPAPNWAKSDRQLRAEREKYLDSFAIPPFTVKADDSEYEGVYSPGKSCICTFTVDNSYSYFRSKSVEFSFSVIDDKAADETVNRHQNQIKEEILKALANPSLHNEELENIEKKQLEFESAVLSGTKCVSVPFYSRTQCLATRIWSARLISRLDTMKMKKNQATASTLDKIKMRNLLLTFLGNCCLLKRTSHEDLRLKTSQEFARAMRLHRRKLFLCANALTTPKDVDLDDSSQLCKQETDNSQRKTLSPDQVYEFLKSKGLINKMPHTDSKFDDRIADACTVDEILRKLVDGVVSRETGSSNCQCHYQLLTCLQKMSTRGDPMGGEPSFISGFHAYLLSMLDIAGFESHFGYPAGFLRSLSEAYRLALFLVQDTLFHLLLSGQGTNESAVGVLSAQCAVSKDYARFIVDCMKCKPTHFVGASVLLQLEEAPQLFASENDAADFRAFHEELVHFPSNPPLLSLFRATGNSTILL